MIAISSVITNKRGCFSFVYSRCAHAARASKKKAKLEYIAHLNIFIVKLEYNHFKFGTTWKVRKRVEKFVELDKK